jgi:hypothetical protein
MTPIEEKIADLRAESDRLAALAIAITNRPELTPEDRKRFEELLELIEEINDYAARLQRPGEKWRKKINA